MIVVDGTSLTGCSAATRRMYDYWNTCRGTRAMPARAEISPHDIPELLPGVIIVDVHWPARQGEIVADGSVIAPWFLTYRLIGTGITRAVRRDATGRDVRDAFHGRSLETTMAKYRLVVDGRKVVYDEERTPEIRHPLAEHGVLLMPLSNNGRRVDNVLGYIEITAS